MNMMKISMMKSNMNNMNMNNMMSMIKTNHEQNKNDKHKYHNHD